MKHCTVKKKKYICTSKNFSTCPTTYEINIVTISESALVQAYNIDIDQIMINFNGIDI